MRVKSVHVQNFRCLEDLVVSLDAFTAFIGSNGSGKSAVLHALNWFFAGTRGDEFDFRVCADGSSVESFSVTVSLVDLDAATKLQWARYIRNGELVLKRVCRADGADQLSGRATQGPNFADIRSETDTTKRRALYNTAKADLGLPAALSKVAIEDALDAWEADPANATKLVEVNDADLSHAFGFNGKNLLQDLVQFVLVPASTRLEGNVDPSEKGGAIDRLLGAVIKLAAEKEVADWVATNATAMAKLGTNISAAVKAASASQVADTNRYLGEMIDGATVTLSLDIQSPKIQPQLDVAASLTLDGPPMPISKQGHGVQRSVMMSTLQAAAHANLGLSTSVLLAIEEPELYQHPARSVALSKALRRLVGGGQWQAVVATHSPSFLGTAAAASLRRFDKSDSVVTVVNGSVEEFARVSHHSVDQVKRHLETLLPSEFANAFFADRVLLVEGVSDQIVVGRVLELMGTEVDAHNWAIVNCGGKQNLPIAAGVLLALRIDVRVVFDGDYRNDSEDTRHEKETKNILRDLANMGLMSAAETYAFKDPSTCFQRVAILQRDIEAEELMWASFMAEMSKHSGSSTTTSKNPYFVREASTAASLDDCSTFLTSVGSMMQIPTN